MKALDFNPSWFNLSVEKKTIVVLQQLDLLEVSEKSKRMNAAKCILYLLQVCSLLLNSTLHDKLFIDYC